MSALLASSDQKRRRVTASHIMTPIENRSDRASTTAPVDCSGDMYATRAALVSIVFGEWAVCANPKSSTLAVPLTVTKTLCGLTSRWTMPSGSPSGPDGGVRVSEPLERAAQRGEVHVQGHGREGDARGRDDLLQRLAVEELHDDERPGLALLDLESRHHVRVIEAARRCAPP